MAKKKKRKTAPKKTANDHAAISALLSITELHFSGKKDSEFKEPSANAKKLINWAKYNDLCSDGKDKLAEAYKLISGEEISMHLGTNDDYIMDIPLGTVIVPTVNGNDHDYPIGKPIVVLGDDDGTCIKSDGSNGNSMGVDYRRATSAEIESLPLKQIRAYASLLR